VGGADHDLDTMTAAAVRVGEALAEAEVAQEVRP
jgi:hypothetical protein